MKRLIKYYLLKISNIKDCDIYKSNSKYYSSEINNEEIVLKNGYKLNTIQINQILCFIKHLLDINYKLICHVPTHFITPYILHLILEKNPNIILNQNHKYNSQFIIHYVNLVKQKKISTNLILYLKNSNVQLIFNKYQKMFYKFIETFNEFKKFINDKFFTIAFQNATKIKLLFINLSINDFIDNNCYFYQVIINNIKLLKFEFTYTDINKKYDNFSITFNNDNNNLLFDFYNKMFYNYLLKLLNLKLNGLFILNIYKSLQLYNNFVYNPVYSYKWSKFNILLNEMKIIFSYINSGKTTKKYNITNNISLDIIEKICTYIYNDKIVDQLTYVGFINRQFEYVNIYNN